MTAARYDVDCVSLTSYLDSYIYDWLLGNPRSNIYALHKAQIPHASNLGCYIDISSLLPALNACRTLKSPHELSLIRHAINLSSFAHRSILHHVSSLNSEAEIHGRFIDICIAHGAKCQAYAPIVASGKNAAVLHYTKNDELLKGKGSVCMDAGCEWDCYASDITRTFPISTHGWPSKETAEIYALVEEMQERCIKQLRPGVAFMDLYVLAYHIAIEGLLRLGFFREGTDIDIIMESGFSRAFFPHGLGHHLGLEVHDVSAKPITDLLTEREQNSVEYVKDDEHIHFNSKNYPALCQAIEGADSRSPTFLHTSVLEENMVLTIEPGICASLPPVPPSNRLLPSKIDFSPPTLSDLYLPNPAFSAIINKSILDRYMHVGGVRIEDDILITTDGFENLTTAPKGEKMLEVIREGAKCQHGLDCEFRASSSLRAA